MIKLAVLHACMLLGLVPLPVRGSEDGETLTDSLPTIDAVLSSAQPAAVVTSARILKLLKRPEVEHIMQKSKVKERAERGLAL